MWHFAIIFSVIYQMTWASSFESYRCQNYKNENKTDGALFLTPYIDSGNIDQGREMAKVENEELTALNITSYAAYLTVDSCYDSNLFFWYFPAKLQPETAPVLLWLQGGPGYSSLYGLFLENGPVFVNNVTGKLETRQYSWHINHHLIYIDNPVGTGFSFTNDDDGYSTDEWQVGTNLHIAMRQFFQIFPNLQQHELYLAGESYAGKYVPALAHRILHHQHVFKMNLQGFALGNGFVDPVNQLNYASYLYKLGLIDRKGFKEFSLVQKKMIKFIKQKEYMKAYELFNSLFNLDGTVHDTKFAKLTGLQSFYNYVTNKSDDANPMLQKFIQSPSTRRSIHVGTKKYHNMFHAEEAANHLIGDIMRSVAGWLSELLNHYRVFIYNGQLDIIVGYPLTVTYLEKLHFAGAKKFATAKQRVWQVDDEVAGYVRKGGNLTSVLILKAGHMVPIDQPSYVLDMLLRLTYKTGF